MAVTGTTTVTEVTRHVRALTFSLEGTGSGTVVADQPMEGEIIGVAYQHPNSGGPDANWDMSLTNPDNPHAAFSSVDVLGQAGQNMPASSTQRSPYELAGNSGPVPLVSIVSGRVSLAVSNFGATTTRTGKVTFFVFEH